MTANKIEKPWCVYGAMSLGKIVYESKTSYAIANHDEAYPNLWKKSTVERFNTIQNAIEFQRKYSGRKPARLIESAQENFPSEF